MSAAMKASASPSELRCSSSDGAQASTIIGIGSPRPLRAPCRARRRCARVFRCSSESVDADSMILAAPSTCWKIDCAVELQHPGPLAMRDRRPGPYCSAPAWPRGSPAGRRRSAPSIRAREGMSSPGCSSPLVISASAGQRLHRKVCGGRSVRTVHRTYSLARLVSNPGAIPGILRMTVRQQAGICIAILMILIIPDLHAYRTIRTLRRP